MPLDPIFAERLRVHRRYLFEQSWKKLKTKLEDAPVLRRGGAVSKSPVPVQAVASPAQKSPAAESPVVSPPAPKLEHRESAGTIARRKHRRAAERWDKKELEQVGTPGPEVHIEEHTVPVAGRPDVRVRLYRPLDSTEEHLPAVLSFYGGAFRIGGIDYPTTDAACRRRAAEARVVIVAVDYAKAPEHKYPVAVEQGYAALAWVAEHAEALAIDPARLAVQGTSAGGCLAAVCALMARDRGGPALRLQVLEVPVLDLTGAHIDFRATYAMGIPAFLAIRELLSVARTYLPKTADARAGYASPLRASAHANLPPALILTAQYDPLRANGAAYGRVLRNAGVDATVVEYLGATHDTSIFTGVLPAARRWHEQVVGALRELHR